MSAPAFDGAARDGSLSGVELSQIDPATGKAESAADRSIIRSGDLVIEVADPAKSADEVLRAIEPQGGTIESSTVSAANEWAPASASLTVRVPSENFEAAIAAISEIGVVVVASRSASDVTLQHRDLSARVTALETSVERLQQLISEASNTADLIAAEGALTERQAELDGLKSQLSYLDDQVDEATLLVTLNAPGTAPAAGPTNFWDALLLGVRSLGAALVGAGLGLGVALPWIIALAVVAGIVIAIVRWSRTRKQDKPETPDSGTTTPPL